MYPRLAHLGSFIVPTYSVVAAIGLVAAMLLAEWCAPRAGVAKDRVWALCVAVLLASVVLSRFVLIAEMFPSFRAYPRLVLTQPTLSRFGPLLVVGCTAVAIAVLRLPWLPTLDAVTPAALLLLTALHLGSFFAGTDLGSGTSLALGNLVLGDEGHHPVALYATVLCAVACVAALLLLLLRRAPLQPHEHHTQALQPTRDQLTSLAATQPGQVFGLGLAAAAIARFVADEFRPGYLLPEAALPGGLRADQLFLIALTVAGMLLLLQRRHHHAQ